MVYLSPVPNLHCFHANCGSALEEVEVKLRKALAGEATPDGRTKKMSAEEKWRQAELLELKRQRQRVRNAKGQILRNWRWTQAEMEAASPVPLSDNTPDHWRLLLERFAQDDRVWVGSTYDSGKPEHSCHFRTVAEWLKEQTVPGQYVCPVTFKEGSFSRSNDNVQARRFLVVESDVLSRDEVGAIFRWMSETLAMTLVAVVDTAGKSLHGWYTCPPENLVRELKRTLPELGCDPKLFTASQPVRLPSALRGDKPQRLVYLSKKEVA